MANAQDSVGTIFKGVTPFWIVDILRLLILLILPRLVLFLPGQMEGRKRKTPDFSVRDFSIFAKGLRLPLLQNLTAQNFGNLHCVERGTLA